MKKTFQKFEITIPATETTLVSEVLKQEYSNCEAVFCTLPNPAQADKLTIGMKIDGAEILPNNTDLSLIHFNGNVSVKDTQYDFAEDNMPARSSQVEFSITNSDTVNEAVVNVYCVLVNK